ncbi:element excision factor XisH family protein [Baaleninema simplex]|uniref:element excision factor XisH family protein n=1 Tax=Baaleninema simplex TaxID=2862350 RepID=UPI000346BB20
MQTRDLFHDSVKNVLQKDGWIITHDPLHFDLNDYEIYIDLGADRLIAAERDRQKNCS